MGKENIIEKYKKILLGTCDYKKDGNFYVENFQNEKQLIYFLDGLESHEHTLTKSGFKFLKEYYGLDKIAELLLKENPNYPFKTKKEIISWLNTKNKFAIKDDEVVQ